MLNNKPLEIVVKYVDDIEIKVNITYENLVDIYNALEFSQFELLETPIDKTKYQNHRFVPKECFWETKDKIKILLATMYGNEY